MIGFPITLLHPTGVLSRADFFICGVLWWLSRALGQVGPKDITRGSPLYHERDCFGSNTNGIVWNIAPRLQRQSYRMRRNFGLCTKRLACSLKCVVYPHCCSFFSASCWSRECVTSRGNYNLDLSYSFHRLQLHGLHLDRPGESYERLSCRLKSRGRPHGNIVGLIVNLDNFIDSKPNIHQRPRQEVVEPPTTLGRTIDLPGLVRCGSSETWASRRNRSSRVQIVIAM